MSDYNYSKLLALMKVVPAYPAAAVAFRDVETIVHEQHERLTLAEDKLETIREGWQKHLNGKLVQEDVEEIRRLLNCGSSTVVDAGVGYIKWAQKVAYEKGNRDKG